MIPFEKFIEDGKVAVLISPGFGAGWSTWNREYPGLLFDAEIVAAVRANDLVLARVVALRKYPDAYLGGLDDLEVAWVQVGRQFHVTEYDGSESLRLAGSQEFITA